MCGKDPLVYNIVTCIRSVFTSLVCLWIRHECPVNNAINIASNIKWTEEGQTWTIYRLKANHWHYVNPFLSRIAWTSIDEHGENHHHQHLEAQMNIDCHQLALLSSTTTRYYTIHLASMNNRNRPVCFPSLEILPLDSSASHATTSINIITTQPHTPLTRTSQLDVLVVISQAMPSNRKCNHHVLHCQARLQTRLHTSDICGNITSLGLGTLGDIQQGRRSVRRLGSVAVMRLQEQCRFHDNQFPCARQIMNQ